MNNSFFYKLQLVPFSHSNSPPPQFLIFLSSFIRNLENLENRPFSQKVREKPGIVRKFSKLSIQVREKSRKSQGKVRETNYLISISFSLTIGMVVRKVAVLIVVCKCDLYALLCEITSIMCITYLLGSIFITSFCKYVSWGRGRKRVF